MMIGVFLGRGVSTKDAVSAAETLGGHLAGDVQWIGMEPGPVVGHDPVQMFEAEVGYRDASPEVLVLPGGFGSHELAGDPDLVDWIGSVAGEARGVLAVSTGTLLLAATGILAGCGVAGHWLTSREIAATGAHLTASQVEVHGRIVTVSGSVSAAFGAKLLADLITYGP
jgi:putative intracellular protease/amidase